MSNSPLIRAAGIVLAGGQSRRMGQDKAQLLYGSRRWIDQMVQTLQGVPCDQVWISGDRPADGGIPDRGFGAVGTGEAERLGPLGGLASVIPNFNFKNGFTHLIVVPVDMPRLSSELLRQLLISLEDAEAAIFKNYPLPFVCRLSQRLTETLDSLCAPEVPARFRSFRTLSRCLQTRELICAQTQEFRLRNFNSPSDLLELAA